MTAILQRSHKRIVDVPAVTHALGVAGVDRREDPCRECRLQVERMLDQPRHDHVVERAVGFMLAVELLIALLPRGGAPGAELAVDESTLAQD